MGVTYTNSITLFWTWNMLAILMRWFMCYVNWMSWNQGIPLSGKFSSHFIFLSAGKWNSHFEWWVNGARLVSIRLMSRYAKHVILARSLLLFRALGLFISKNTGQLSGMERKTDMIGGCVLHKYANSGKYCPGLGKSRPLTYVLARGRELITYVPFLWTQENQLRRKTIWTDGTGANTTKQRKVISQKQITFLLITLLLKSIVQIHLFETHQNFFVSITQPNCVTGFIFKFLNGEENIT